MRRSKLLLPVLLAGLCLAGPLPTLRAAFTTSGDVEPSDPSTWTSSTDVYVGYTSNGTLTVDGGSDLLSFYGYIGGWMAGYTGSGTVTVNGAGSTWSNSGGLYVGSSGSGTLNITNGGSVSSSGGYLGDLGGYPGASSGAAGTVTVNGAGSMWNNSGILCVGSSGSGTLSITNGGSVSSTYGYVGYNSGSAGTVTVNGTGSMWSNSGSLSVGSSGSGTLSITNGGSVSSSRGYIGYQYGSAGTATVSGTGSMWSNSGILCVGYYGSGTLNITNGGTVSNSSGWIGCSPVQGCQGTVTVDGTGSTWSNSSDLYVGDEGSGTLKITNGGAVSAADTTYVGCLGLYAGSTGTINFGANGGTLTTASLVASPTQVTGTGTVNSRGLVSDTDLTFDSTHGLSQTLTFSSLPGQNVAVNLDMSNPANNGALGAGYQGAGSLTIQDGIAVVSAGGYLGYNSGSAGTVTVNGTGSMWNNSGILCVGYYGSGTLNITNGGTVSNSSGWIGGYLGGILGASSGAAGTVTVSGAGSTWNNSGGLYVGSYCGIGTLNITNGGTVSSSGGYLGYSSGFIGSAGTVTVNGTGSMWNNSGILCVGYYGSGTLNITNGGTVSSSGGYIGGYTGGSKGTVTVDGAGSTWTNSGSLYVGSSGGSGTLSISGGGGVTAGSVSINSTSLLAIDVGRGSSLVVSGGSGTITNSGTVRILAGAGVSAGNTYSPISAGMWTGNWKYQAVGGTRNTSSQQFTVSSVATGTSGSPISIDLASQQRVLVSDSSTGWSVGESFLATTSSSTLTCTATTISGGTLTSLSSSLGTGQTVLSGWTFSATSGYASGTPVYLSFGVGAAQLLNDLQVWSYGGGRWTEYPTTDLTYDRTYASLTVTALGVYAVTGDLVLAGDANRDGTTNGVDLDIVLSNYNKTGMTWAQGDFDGDGTVNGTDLDIVLSNYNKSVGVSASIAVPEPCTLALLAAGLFGAAAYG